MSQTQAEPVTLEGPGDLPSVRLSAGGAVAEVSARGAELRSWLVAGRPLLWTPDAAFWSETAPILFPVVGWTRNGAVRVGSDRYPLGVHGFARRMAFRIDRSEPDFVRMVLDSDDETRRLYPFDFSLAVEYRLAAASLSVGLIVINRGLQPMPYACGLHPGFCWPFAGGDQADYRVLFDAEEEPRVPLITPQGLFSSASRPIPLAGRSLPLSPDLFAQEALCLLDARSRGLAFEHRDGATIRIDTENFRHFALWSRPGAPFLSIEAWTGYGDPEAFDGDLFAKPSMRILSPGAEARHVARFAFTMGQGSTG